VLLEVEQIRIFHQLEAEFKAQLLREAVDDIAEYPSTEAVCSIAWLQAGEEDVSVGRAPSLTDAADDNVRQFLYYSYNKR